MKLEVMGLGVIGTNCYLLTNTETREVIIVDPADGAERLVRKMQLDHTVPVAVLLTHAHFDHIGAVDDLVKLCGPLPVYVMDVEAGMLSDPFLNASLSMLGQRVTAHADHLLHDGQVLHLAGSEIRVIHTPGHTAGSVCFYFPEDKVLISGDTLFRFSVGRTDLPTGSMAALHRSLHERLFALPDDVTVYPGHGEETTIGEEKKYNPY